MTRSLSLLTLLGTLALVGCGDKDADTDTNVGADDTGDIDDSECDTDVDADCDGVADEDDCDPNDRWTYPGATEVPYDGKDNDCAGDGDLTDVDGDGFDGTGAGGPDCNDNNPTINPDAAEVCYDGIDQDCDGFPANPDEDTLDCDGDGYIGIGTEATDCNDEDPEIYPGAEETWYDGVDSDCSGVTTSDYDQDGDGEDHDGYGGTDCNDEDATIFSDADERWDGLDNDCDDVIDTLSILDASASYYANTSSGDGYFGLGFADVGDIDGDGLVDFGVGGPFSGSDPENPVGWWQVFRHADGDGVPSSVAHTLIYGQAGSWFGWDAANMGDLDGDGLPEIAIGAPLHVTDAGGYGTVFVMGSTSVGSGAEVAQGSAMARLTGVTYVGLTVNPAGDVDDDGIPDLVGAGSEYLISVGNGINLNAAIWSGADIAAASGDEISSTEALATITGTTPGGDIQGGADLDGDGIDDLVFGINVAAGGSIVVIPGTHLTGNAALSTADYPKIAGSLGDNVGAQVAVLADMNGDGYAEIITSAPTDDGDASAAGTVYLISAPDVVEGGNSAANVAWATILGTESDGNLGLTSDVGANFDNDGVDDFVVSTTGVWSSGFTPHTYVFNGSVVAGGGTFRTPDDVSATFKSRTADDGMGYQGATFDVDGDGDDEIFVGAPFNNDVGMAAYFENLLQ